MDVLNEFRCMYNVVMPDGSCTFLSHLTSGGVSLNGHNADLC